MFFRFYKKTAFIFFIAAISYCIAWAWETKDVNGQVCFSDKLLVKFKFEVTEERRAAIRKELGAELVKYLKEMSVEVWKLPKGLSVEEAADKLKKEKGVECAEPDYIYKPQTIH